MVVSDVRRACREVAEQARHVSINNDLIALYAASLPEPAPAQSPLLDSVPGRELMAWYWLTLDTINFGSGWFPTLRKRPGRTGYSTVAAGLRNRFDRQGPWSAAELTRIDREELAADLQQDPEHQLIELFVAALADFGAHLEQEHGGDVMALIAAADGSAVALVEILSGWQCFADVSTYDGFEVPFYKRAQIAAADLARAGVAEFPDLGQLTMFADNLVPHVLRLDGVLAFDPALVARIEQEDLIEHGSPEEVEIRACAVEAVERLIAAWPGGSQARPSAAQLDQLLWQRGQGRLYKASPRHRSRSTAY